jgi:hypothetical protein
MKVGGPLQYVAFLYLGVSLLARPHATVWHVAGLVLLVAAFPPFMVSVWRFFRDRPAVRGDFPVDRPVVGIEADDRGEWLYSPSAAGTEIELRLRGQRYVAAFAPGETQAYRRVIAGITETLNGGVRSVDINAAFAEVIGREPFRHRGPTPPTLTDRLLGSTR